ncbi:3-oxoacyl-ACP synthase III family protein [Flagellimonas meridianipacifica]|uniref:3-oxoacyl-[acyl-carrier-protein] synthase-3 n=1 Tax=Flagellimonas meridianipacifica TaxID=1080225 RepID=A0A2T0M854_9FLAO|nr:ketoacyl-ACP synthase III [Allomuricauda pacifica]PRX53649.1 3-oxoacyl-[acyl-carrier-protein] synthase-3 [Allomuricauda pacifica]
MKIGITGTGSYIPSVVTKNEDFLEHDFLGTDGSSFEVENAVIIEKFKSITGIAERRYAKPELKTSDLGYLAAEKALENSGIDKEELDYIIFAHNFGDLTVGKSQGDTLPSLATRVKHLLQIKNPKCVAYDTIFGCPGWIEGVIQASAYIKSGMAKKCLVIGGETLSRVIDEHDRDSMIYSDGAGAAIIENNASGEILSHTSVTHANGEAYFLFFDKTYNEEGCSDTRYIKMHGRKIYEFACTHVPKAMADCLEDSGVSIEDVKKIFIHQANEKMDEAIIKRFYRIYGKEAPKDIMPMSIHKLGNSSVATIPTLFDLVRKGDLEEHEVHKGDVVIFASVGAGMNINAIVYRY